MGSATTGSEATHANFVSRLLFPAFPPLAVKAGMKPGDEARRRELPHTRTREQSHSQSSVPPDMGAWE